MQLKGLTLWNLSYIFCYKSHFNFDKCKIKVKSISSDSRYSPFFTFFIRNSFLKQTKNKKEKERKKVESLWSATLVK